MWIDHEFLGRALIKVLISLWPLIQRNHSHIDRFGDFDFVVEDGHHQRAVVFHDGALSRGEVVGFCPTQPDANAEVADLGVLIDATRDPR
jgi:hypothetical protein